MDYLNKYLTSVYRYIFVFIAIIEPIWGFYVKYYMESNIETLIWDRFLVSLFCCSTIWLTYQTKLYEKYFDYILIVICYLILVQQEYILYVNQDNLMFSLSAFGTLVFTSMMMPSKKQTYIYSSFALASSLLFNAHHYILFFNLVTFVPLTVIFKIKLFTLLNEKTKVDEHLKNVKQSQDLGVFANGISHYLNNSLVKISMSGELLESQFNNRAKVPKERIFKNCRTISNEAHVIAGVFDSIKILAGNQNTKYEKEDLIAIVKGESIKVKKELDKSNIKFVFSNDVYDESVFINLNKSDIIKIIESIIANAREFLNEKNSPDPTIWLRVKKQKKKIVVSFENNGGAIPLDIRSKIFEGFFSSKDISHSKGLGLNLCVQIAESHGGELFLQKYDKDNITKFVLELPITE